VGSTEARGIVGTLRALLAYVLKVYCIHDRTGVGCTKWVKVGLSMEQKVITHSNVHEMF
jgi:hypothetical protein